jgi:hypothetical protein
VNSTWLYYVLRSKTAQEQADAAATGTAQRTVGLMALRSFAVPNASPDEQERAVQRLDGLRMQTESLSDCYKTKLQLLHELEQSLIQRALSGDLTGRAPFAA